MRTAKAENDWGLLGTSESMQRLRAQIALVGPSPAATLILGETGVGKELVANAVHACSRAKGPLVPVNCGALTTRESARDELFGHQKASFTGALSERPGVVRAAHLGTLFLDEVAELSEENQALFLRALQVQKVTPVGCDRELPVEFRLVAATHRSLEELVEASRFRRDLFFRLHGLSIEVPPLRERGEDLPLLVAHFTRARRGEGAPAWSEAALQKVKAHPFPGNVRELEYVVERALTFAEGEAAIGPEHVTFSALGQKPARRPGALDCVYLPGKRLEDVEVEVIKKCLRRNRGDKAAARDELGISKATLNRFLAKHGPELDDPDQD